MKNFLKYLLLLGLLLPSSFPMELEKIEGAVIIVGSTRTPGSVIPNISELVQQEKADFTYKKRFQGLELLVLIKSLAIQIKNM